MLYALLAAILIFTGVMLILLIIIFKRKPEGSASVLTELLSKNNEKIESSLKDEMSRNRAEGSTTAKQAREELNLSMKTLSDSLMSRITEMSNLQNTHSETFTKQINTLTETNETKLEKMRLTLEEKIRHLQDDNAKRLEQMRATVDEKLNETLEKRLAEKFTFVSERLDMVHKGLGEMQSLAVGVGDLKKMLSNVKTRGTWGEVQLENLLEQILTPEQYEKNIPTKKGSKERVEFAIKLPSKEEGVGSILIPIDCKFPMEDYQRLVEAQEIGDIIQVTASVKLLENRIKGEAKSIKDKYINPPLTTDFGLLYLPIEGLYAEVLRIPGLFEKLQNEYKVIIAGPTTITAILHSFQMGFRTLAIQKRSSEVWSILGSIKNEFGKFSVLLEKTQKKLTEAGNTIEEAASKSRSIEQKLSKVQEMPKIETPEVIPAVELIGADNISESKDIEVDEIPF